MKYLCQPIIPSIPAALQASTGHQSGASQACASSCRARASALWERRPSKRVTVGCCNLPLAGNSWVIPQSQPLRSRQASGRALRYSSVPATVFQVLPPRPDPRLGSVALTYSYHFALQQGKEEHEFKHTTFRLAVARHSVSYLE